MTLLVDTSVWSLALRRDAPADEPEVTALRTALAGSELVVTTGLILQEILQGFVPDAVRSRIVERFASMPLIVPTREDHIAAAGIRTVCRRAGVQVGTMDALIAQLVIAHGLTLLTTDRDFHHMAAHVSLRVWG